MKTDYSDLEGKEVTLINTYESCQLIVVGCDYHIGITLVKKEDKEQYVLCLVGKAAFRKVYGDNLPNIIPYKGAKYRRLFSYLVKRIKKGELNVFDTESFLCQEGIKYNTTVLPEDCPYK